MHTLRCGLVGAHRSRGHGLEAAVDVVQWVRFSSLTVTQLRQGGTHGHQTEVPINLDAVFPLIIFRQ